jgi:hypothetical protein
MKINSQILCKVAGVTFEGRQEIINLMVGNEVAMLIPEPDNKYDPNAIAVWIAFPPESGYEKAQIGYLPKQVAEQVAPMLDGEKTQCKVDEITGGFEMWDGENANYGVVLSIELPEMLSND